MSKHSNLVVVRGGGDIATGTICRLHNAGFAVLILETARPTAIRRAVSFCEAVYDGEKNIEGVVAKKIETIEEYSSVLRAGKIPLFIDPKGDCLQKVQPLAVIDAILAKRNCGTTKDMAAITIGLGPGFCAGTDVHAVVETRRGHDLGRVLYRGMASANTGIPGEIKGYSKERVIYSPLDGRWQGKRDIGSQVATGDIIGCVDLTPVTATIPGIIRGMIRDQFRVSQGLKIADIDPRVEEVKNCTTISDKARCVSGGVLEAVLHLSAVLGKK